MSVDRDEVTRIAALARLELEPDEVERLTHDMNRILTHAAHLGEVEALADAGGTGVGDAPEVESTDGGGPPAGADAGVGGGRVGAPGAPDALAAPVDAWGPRVEDGFFVVPPLPGTRAGEPS